MKRDEEKGTTVRYFHPYEHAATPSKEDNIRVVMAAQKQPRRRRYYRAWVIDAGSPFDIVQKSNVERMRGVTIERATHPVGLQKAGGDQAAGEIARMTVNKLKEDITAFALPNTPEVLSVGYRCRRHGFRFVWEEYSEFPYLEKDGKRCILAAIHDIPCLFDEIKYEEATPEYHEFVDKLLNDMGRPAVAAQIMYESP